MYSMYVKFGHLLLEGSYTNYKPTPLLTSHTLVTGGRLLSLSTAAFVSPGHGAVRLFQQWRGVVLPSPPTG